MYFVHASLPNMSVQLPGDDERKGVFHNMENESGLIRPGIVG